MAASSGGRLRFTADGTLVACDPSGTDGRFNRNTQNLEMANGSDNNIVDTYDGPQTVNPTAMFPLTAVSLPILTACGVGGTWGAPNPITLLYNYDDYGKSFTNCLANVIEISLAQNGTWMVNIQFLATDPPTTTGGGGSTAPDAVYIYWKDTTVATSLASSGGSNLRSFKATLNNNLVPDDGVRSDGFSMPNSYKVGSKLVTFEIGLRKTSSADLATFYAACQTDGDIIVAASRFCTPSGSISATLHHAVYDNETTNQALRQITSQTFTGRCRTPAGANPFVLAVA